MSSTQTLVAHDLVPPRPTPAPNPGAARTRLLLEGPIIPTLLRLGAPNVIVNVVLIAVTASVDAHFVGHLGSNALAGLALVFGVGPVPPLGITGAEIATVGSFTLSTLALTWYVLSGRTVLTLSFRSVRLSRRLFVEILRVGAPSSLTPILGNLTLAVLTGFVATLGPAALAGFGAAVRLEYVQVPLTFGLGVGVLAMVGTNIGAGQLARAARITWIAAGLAVTATGGIGVLIATWPEIWTSFFTTDPAVHAAAASYLGVVALTYPFLGLGFTLAYAFQAAGRPWWPMLAMVGRVLLVAAGGWIAVHSMESGLRRLALVCAGGLLLQGSTLAVAFHAGAWRSMSTLSRA